jgi:hypothetical protein
VIIACASSQFYRAHGMKAVESAGYLSIDRYLFFDLRDTLPAHLDNTFQ